MLADDAALVADSEEVEEKIGGGVLAYHIAGPVMPKRTNKPGISTSNRPPRGVRMARGRGRFYSGYRPTRRPSRYSTSMMID
ncbi:hypothetical protein E2C01_016816 [Portunus trituberculatus]|uniref:Uncharacterized protein n=1 Tax=Portunus trituberculatus TaxID=210409 RepID=A0A5B7DR89_PORTR|nr:hypothetical protein [Portunus trituberculatus]